MRRSWRSAPTPRWQLEALIGEHPYRERLRAQLTPALYRCDRPFCVRGAWVEPETAINEASNLFSR